MPSFHVKVFHVRAFMEMERESMRYFVMGVLLAGLISPALVLARPTALAREVAQQAKEKKEEFEVKKEILRPLQTKFFELEGDVRSRERSLEEKRQPVYRALEKYRRVQQLSLEYPEVTTESERRDYMELRSKTDEETRPQQEELFALREKLNQAYEKLAVAQKELDLVAREIENLNDKAIEAKSIMGVSRD
ncbi:MAG: hypothetical protein HQL63_11385 [Magnetococcales bacterium]|nr:hypothetical protein [Magnetococcales bacterium]